MLEVVLIEPQYVFLSTQGDSCAVPFIHTLHLDIKSVYWGYMHCTYNVFFFHKDIEINAATKPVINWA